MISLLTVRNFRSIEEATLELRRLNLFYGPTASGKSSVLYALLVLKNFVGNPNRPVDGLFDLGFTNLGGFEACVFDHERNREVTVACTVGSGEETACYAVAFSPVEATVKLRFLRQHELTARVTLPYPVNQNFTAQISGLSVNWNGIAASVAPPTPEPEVQEPAAKLAMLLNRPADIIREVDIAPQKRGFYKPSYTATSLSLIPTTDAKSPPSSSRNRILRHASRFTSSGFWAAISGSSFLWERRRRFYRPLRRPPQHRPFWLTRATASTRSFTCWQSCYGQRRESF